MTCYMAYGKRDLFMQLTGIPWNLFLWQKWSISMGKETYFCGKRDLLYGKRDLFMQLTGIPWNLFLWQKRSISMGKETYFCGKRDLLYGKRDLFMQLTGIPVAREDFDLYPYVTSSYILCHIIIHTMSHHHTYYVTSSYLSPERTLICIPARLHCCTAPLTCQSKNTKKIKK